MTLKTNKEFKVDAEFSIKEMPDSDGDGKLVITGYANTITKDRAGDVIPSHVWDQDESMKDYLNNPIVLFQHNHSDPIGKMVNYAVDAKGLFVEIEIFDVVPRVFKLIKEGVLKAFSVGFRMKDYDYDPKEDTFTINELALHEISVVSIPCNQDSTFSLKKSMNLSDYAELKEQAITAKSLHSEANSDKPQTPLFNSELEKLAYMLDNQ